MLGEERNAGIAFIKGVAALCVLCPCDGALEHRVRLCEPTAIAVAPIKSQHRKSLPGVAAAEAAIGLSSRPYRCPELIGRADGATVEAIARKRLIGE